MENFSKKFACIFTRKFFFFETTHGVISAFTVYSYAMCAQDNLSPHTHGSIGLQMFGQVSESFSLVQLLIFP